MKRVFAITLLVLLALPLVSCQAKNPMRDSLTTTRNTGSIEIRVYSVTDQTYTDYVITDREAVREICDTFSSLKLEKVRITEPLGISYSVSFCNASGIAVNSLAVVAGKNVIDYGGLYRVQDDVDIQAYAASLVEKAQPKE